MERCLLSPQRPPTWMRAVLATCILMRKGRTQVTKLLHVDLLEITLRIKQKHFT